MPKSKNNRLRVGASLALLAGLGACSRTPTNDQPAPTSSASVASVVPSATVPVDPEAERTKALTAQTTFEDAIRVIKPRMADTENVPSPGAALLAAWAAKHLRWEEAAPQRDETSPALMLKDPDGERGKRLCATGTIMRIRVSRLEGAVYTTGILQTERKDNINFLAVRDTGDLVNGSVGKFCGAVAGHLVYKSPDGNDLRTLQVVGMFDLPTNHAPIKAP